MLRTIDFLIPLLLVIFLTSCLAAPAQRAAPTTEIKQTPQTIESPTNEPPPPTVEAEQQTTDAEQWIGGLVGTWKLMALENLRIDGAVVPLEQSEFAEMTQVLADGLQAEYQFTEDGTVAWQLRYESEQEQWNESSSGNYDVSSDEQLVTLRMPRHWVATTIAGTPRDARIVTLELNVLIQGDRLTLQYTSEADDFSIDLVFEKVE
jgi:glucose/arabinose dehydrogenase